MGHEDRDLLPLGSTFDIVRRGYDRGQVDEHLDRLDADLRILAADRDAAVARASELTKQVENQRAQIINNERELARLAATPTSMEGMSDRLQRMLRLAQEEATDITSRAEAQAAEMIARAEADGAALRDRYQQLIAEVEERRAAMEDEHGSLLDAARAEAARLIAEATSQAQQAEAESAARRRQVEEDFEIAMSARRTESMRMIAEQEATSKAEAERRITAATTEANRRLQEATDISATMVADAQAEVDRLRGLRDQIAEQLRRIRTVLAEATDAVAPLDENQPDGIPHGTPDATSDTVPAAGSAAEDATRPVALDTTAQPEQPGERAGADQAAEPNKAVADGQRDQRSAPAGQQKAKTGKPAKAAQATGTAKAAEETEAADGVTAAMPAEVAPDDETTRAIPAGRARQVAANRG